MNTKRLESLDILRGMDLFLLTVLGPVVSMVANTGDYSWESAVMPAFEHVEWEGFRLWDIIMPLFMFMSGITIPFSMAKYRQPDGNKAKAYGRIARRVVLLWICGMIVQGNLLGLEWQHVRFFSNTLQAIAVGYLVSSIAFLNSKPRTHLILAAALLAAYWALMMFVGGGDFTPQGNLCEKVDCAVLGIHRDAARLADDGSIVFPAWYTYTWIVSSLTFAATVLSGMLAGELLKSKRSEKSKVLTLLIGGAAMVAVGWLWNLQMPVIKHIWTSSMVLVASGYSFLALAVVYFIVDVRKKGRWSNWLKVFGMNSIAAYMMAEFLRFDSIPQSIFYGLHHYVGDDWYRCIIGLGSIAVMWGILYALYKRRVFIRL